MADDKKKKDDEAKDAPAEGEAPEGGAAPAEGGAESGGSRFSRKKIILAAALSVILLIAAGGGAYFYMHHDKQLVCDNVKEGDADFDACETQRAAATDNKPVSFIDVPDIIVNLNSTSKQPRFLKITMKIELDTELDKKNMEKLLPRVVDQFQMYLRELRIEDLRGTSGIYRLKIELLNRVRASAPNVRVRDVLFQEILVQ